MHTRDELLVHALRVLMITRHAFGLQTHCNDPRFLMSFFRLFKRTGSVGEIRGIQVRHAAPATLVPPAQEAHEAEIVQGMPDTLGAGFGAMTRH